MNLSPLVATCEKVWESIQKYNSDVPEVVIVVGSGGRRANSLLGHFAKNTWGDEDQEIHEVLLVAENLNRSAEDVFRTLIHEAVHGIAHVRGIKDCSGQRHNRKFALLCEEVGLIPPEKPDAKIGFSAAQLSDELRELFAQEIDALEEQLKLCRKLVTKEKETKKTTWVAACNCDRKIRMPKKSIINPQELDIVCGICDGDFTLEDDDMEAFVGQMR